MKRIRRWWWCGCSDGEAAAAVVAVAVAVVDNAGELVGNDHVLVGVEVVGWKKVVEEEEEEEVEAAVGEGVAAAAAGEGVEDGMAAVVVEKCID